MRVEYNQPFDDLLSRLVPPGSTGSSKKSKQLLGPENPLKAAGSAAGDEEQQGPAPSTVVVLGGWLANPSPPLIRALKAYRKLDLTGVTPRAVRALTKSAQRLTDAQRTRLVERYAAGATVYDLAAEFGVSRVTVSNQLKAAGVTLRNGPLTEREIARCIELYATGLSTAAVGKKIGRDHAAVWRALTNAGVRLRDAHGRERPAMSSSA